MTDPGLATASAFKQSDEIEQYENNDEKKRDFCFRGLKLEGKLNQKFITN